MKNSHLYFILFTSLFSFSGKCQDLSSIESTKIPAHPRLLWFEHDISPLLLEISKDENWSYIHRVILAESDKMIPLPTLERIQIGKRLLDKSRECLKRVFYLSYSYKVTKENKYLERAEKELLKVSQFSDWNPSHFLDVAEMTMAVAIGYDWLFDRLSEDTRRILKEAILKKGLEPSLNAKHNSWLKAKHNWNQVCNTGMTFGALAIYEDEPELAKNIIRRAVTSIQLPMADYGPDGAYPEGYGYWVYGTSFNLMFLSAIEKIYGHDFDLSKTKGFLKAAAYFVHMVGTSGKAFNYSDAQGGAGFTASVFWFANKTKDPSLLFNQVKFLDKKIGGDRLFPAIMMWGRGLDLTKIEEPKKLIWTGQGPNPVALMRSSWSDPNALYVGFKVGSPSVNHGHMDIGSFVMDAMGQRWSMDFGMQEYESLESKGIKLWGKEQESQRWDVFRYNNLAHSTLSFDGQYQKVDGYAKIDGFTDAPAFLSAQSDVSSVYKNQISKFSRGVALVNKAVVVVQDELETADTPRVVRWNMVTPAAVEFRGKGEASLTQNGKTLFLKVLEPNDVELKTWSTQSSKDFDAPNPNTLFVGFELKLPKHSRQNITVALVPEGKPFPKNKEIRPLSQWKN
jgi:hypothetical protein